MHLIVNVLSLLLFLALSPSLKAAAQEIILQDPLPSCKGFTIFSSAAPTMLGVSVDGGGDINGDRIPDIIVADYQFPNPCAVYVIYGTKTGYTDIDVTTMTQKQGFKITGPIILCGAYSTNFVSIAGDVDGDGINDIVITAGCTPPSGTVFVIYGKKEEFTNIDVSTLTPDKGFKITGTNIGISANSKSDLNGDKISDILVSGYSTTATPGIAYIVYGQSTRGSDLDLNTMPSSRGFKITGNTGDNFSGSLSSAGDFNNDYVEDALMTAPTASGDIGNAYVIYGKKGTRSDFSLSGMTPSQGFTLTGQSPYVLLGMVSSDAGDFNNDGISDIAMSTFYTPSTTIAGYAMILYGKQGGPTDFSTSAITPSDGFRIEGVTVGDQFGSFLSSARDLNGDGITDLLIGARGYSSGIGALYAIFGREDQPSTIDLSTLTPNEGFKIVGSVAGGTLGFGGRSINDINQDGVPDLLIGAPSGAGRVYVLFGANSWGCDTCDTSSTCKTCRTGFDYTYNGLCYTKCPIYAPYPVGSQCFAEEPLPGALKDAVKRGGVATYAANRVLNLWNPSSALPFIYGQLKTSIIYMRYLNISRLQKLEDLYQVFVDTDVNPVPFIAMSESVKDAFPAESLPYMFEKYEIPSSFVANFGDDLAGLGAVFGVLVVAQLFSRLLMRKSNHNKYSLIVKKVLGRVSMTLTNFLIGEFGESFGQMILFASLEFRSRNTGKGYYILSPISCCFSLILGFSIFSLCLWILRKFDQVRKTPHTKQQQEEFASLKEKYEGTAVLFDEFKNSSFFQQSGFLVFTLKAISESLSVSLLFEYPLTQAVLLLLLTLTLLAYIIIKRPFESKLALIQQSILIFTLLICNFGLILMAAADVTLSNFQNTLESTSQTIIWALVMFQFVPLAFFVIDLAEALWKLCRWYLTIRAKKEVPRTPAKINQIHPSSSSSLYPSVLSINNSRTHLTKTVLSPRMSRDHQSLMLSFDAENITTSKKLDLSRLTSKEKAFHRISVRERVRLTNISLKSKELID